MLPRPYQELLCSSGFLPKPLKAPVKQFREPLGGLIVAKPLPGDLPRESFLPRFWHVTARQSTQIEAQEAALRPEIAGPPESLAEEQPLPTRRWHLGQ